MTLQNVGITHLLDRIVNLVGVEFNSEKRKSVEKQMRNMWDTIRLHQAKIEVGQNLTVEILDNGDYQARFGTTVITSGALLDCRDGNGKNIVTGGSESAAVFMERDYRQYSIQILPESVFITGQNSQYNDETMKWICSVVKQ
jgi:hypothetical protein